MSSVDQQRMRMKTSTIPTFDWEPQAACRDFVVSESCGEVNPYFPENPETVYSRENAQRYIDKYLPCKRCPVKNECANVGSLNREVGVWGGKLRTLRNRVYGG